METDQDEELTLSHSGLCDWYSNTTPESNPNPTWLTAKNKGVGHTAALI